MQEVVVNDIIFLIGRIIVGIYFLYNASNHFRQLEMMSQYAATKNVPIPKISVILSGVLLVIGGLFILLGVFPEVAILSLIIFFLPVTFIMHNFWTIEDPQMKMGDKVNFIKNIALLGFSLILAGIPTPWPYSLSL